ncbi:MAG TPA: YkgJ family cysteine cluster protein [Lacipirellulaceae bacterium]|nr:YkgJ family cysteine cluster protein [Lacipirellulaceae bacterium]
MDSPWYSAGLKFACTRCGDCCTKEGYVFVNRDERNALAKKLKLSRMEFERAFTHRLGRLTVLKINEDESCIFYKAGCTVYDARPSQCRTFPFWPENLATEEDWAETCKTCPGSGRGGLVTADEITQRLRESRSTAI